VSDTVLLTVSDAVATITLNRPDALNSLTLESKEALLSAISAVAADPAVRAVLLTGAGRGFCAGADMSALQGIRSGGQRERTAEEPFDKSAHGGFQHTYSYFPSVPKPIIAAINGPCAGLGMVIALYADMRFASENAVFMTAFSRRGLIAEHGISWLLPRLVGIANAADLLFSARRVQAAEAHAIGLVSRVFPAEQFEAEVLAYAKMLASEVSPRSLREMKREIWNAQFQTLGEAIDAADKDMAASFASEDFREGVAHFVEKRAPAFTGR
jgi:enoyl-CoA hydratase/carnithine racemase